jgi:hypothetical protein
MQALRVKHTWLSNLRDAARELQRQGVGIEETRRRLLGRESALHHVSRGDFSGTLLIQGLLKA